MVIYGLGGSVKDAMRLSRFGLNAVFQEPLERPAALKILPVELAAKEDRMRRFVQEAKAWREDSRIVFGEASPSHSP